MLVLCAILITAGIILVAVDDFYQSRKIQKLHFKLLDLEKQVYGLDFVDDFISKEVCAAIMQIERRERNLQACLKCSQCRGR